MAINFNVGSRQAALGPPAEAPFVPLPFNELFALGQQQKQEQDSLIPEGMAEERHRFDDAFFAKDQERLDQEVGKITNRVASQGKFTSQDKRDLNSLKNNRELEQNRTNRARTLENLSFVEDKIVERRIEGSLSEANALAVEMEIDAFGAAGGTETQGPFPKIPKSLALKTVEPGDFIKDLMDEAVKSGGFTENKEGDFIIGEGGTGLAYEKLLSMGGLGIIQVGADGRKLTKKELADPNIEKFDDLEITDPTRMRSFFQNDAGKNLINNTRLDLKNLNGGQLVPEEQVINESIERYIDLVNNQANEKTNFISKQTLKARGGAGSTDVNLNFDRSVHSTLLSNPNETALEVVDGRLQLKGTSYSDKVVNMVSGLWEGAKATVKSAWEAAKDSPIAATATGVVGLMSGIAGKAAVASPFGATLGAAYIASKALLDEMREDPDPSANAEYQRIVSEVERLGYMEKYPFDEKNPEKFGFKSIDDAAAFYHSQVTGSSHSTIHTTDDPKQLEKVSDVYKNGARLNKLANVKIYNLQTPVPTHGGGATGEDPTAFFKNNFGVDFADLSEDDLKAIDVGVLGKVDPDNPMAPGLYKAHLNTEKGSMDVWMGGSIDEDVADRPLWNIYQAKYKTTDNQFDLQVGENTLELESIFDPAPDSKTVTVSKRGGEFTEAERIFLERYITAGRRDIIIK